MTGKFVRQACLILTVMGFSLPVLAAQHSDDLGKAEYDLNCAICHGPDGKGQGGFGDTMLIPVPDLTTLASRNKGALPVARMYGVIDGREALRSHGLRRMPTWGNYYIMMASTDTNDYRHAAEAYVRSRIIALIDYLDRIQTR
jgi:mono/diheme cytochrome c family protein